MEVWMVITSSAGSMERSLVISLSCVSSRPCTPTRLNVIFWSLILITVFLFLCYNSCLEASG